MGDINLVLSQWEVGREFTSADIKKEISVENYSIRDSLSALRATKYICRVRQVKTDSPGRKIIWLYKILEQVPLEIPKNRKYDWQIIPVAKYGNNTKVTQPKTLDELFNVIKDTLSNLGGEEKYDLVYRENLQLKKELEKSQEIVERLSKEKHQLEEKLNKFREALK